MKLLPVDNCYNNRYFSLNQLSTGVECARSKNKSGASAFLQDLYLQLKVHNRFFLSDEWDLSEIVNDVVTGYQDKQCCLFRIWQCFVNILCAPLRWFGIYLTEEQEIFHLKEQIEALLPSAQIFRCKIKSESRSDIPSIEAALKLGKVEEAKALLLNLSVYGSSDLPLFLTVMTGCMQEEIDFDPLLARICTIDLLFDEKPAIQQFIHNCIEQGKKDLLIASLKKLGRSSPAKNRFLDALVLEALEKKDKRLLLTLKDLEGVSRFRIQQAAEMVYGQGDLASALEIAIKLRYEPEGRFLILKVAESYLNKNQLELAVQAIEKIPFHHEEEKKDVEELLSKILSACVSSGKKDLENRLQIHTELLTDSNFFLN